MADRRAWYVIVTWKLAAAALLLSAGAALAGPDRLSGPMIVGEMPAAGPSALYQPVQAARPAQQQAEPEPQRIPVSELGAGRIEEALEAAIADYFPQGGIPGVLELSGGVTVRIVGERYAVALPRIRLLNPLTGEQADLGAILMTMTPFENGQYAVSMRLPGTVEMVDADGAATATLEIEDQAVTGFWDSRFETFLQFDAELEGITLTIADAAVPVMELGRAEMTVDVSRDNDNRLSGPTRLRLEDLIARDGAGSLLFRAQTFSIDGRADGVDALSYNRFARRLNGILNALVPPPPAPPPEKETTSLLYAQLQAELLDLPALLTGTSGRVEILDMRTNLPGNVGIVEAPEIRYGFDARGFRDDAARFGLSYEHRGMVVTPVPDGLDILPRNASFRIEIDNLPNAALWQLVTDLPAEMDLYGEAPALQFAFEKFLYQLGISQAEIRLRDTFVSSTNLDLRMIADARFDSNAVYFLAAAANMSLIGLDGMISHLQGVPEAGPADSFNAQPQERPQPNPLGLLLAGILDEIRRYGEVADDVNGRSAHKYEVFLRPEGTVLINGFSLQQILESETENQ